MRSTASRAMAALLAVLCVQAVQAQFWERVGNPTVAVAVEHPPSMGMQVERIVFGPASGQCADEIVQVLVTDFVSNGLEVIDRANLDTILAEYDFALSGHIDPATALQMGKMLGPSVMVVVDVTRCAAETNFSKEQVTRTVTNDDGEKEEVSETIYRLAAQGFLRLSLRTIDLTTGRIFAARALAYASPTRNYSSKSGYPDEPSRLELLDHAMDAAVRDVRRMFLPWTEDMQVIFYDDRKCGLRNAYLALQAGNPDRAYELSEHNLAACRETPRVKDKLLSRAYYNVGILHMLSGDYDGALEYLDTAADIRPGGAIINEAIASVRRAKELAVSMQSFEEEEAILLARRDDEEERRRYEMERRQQEADAKTLRNGDIIEMAKNGIPTSIILTKLRSSTHDFDTSTSAIVGLLNAGVDEQVINAMVAAEVDSKAD